MDNRPEGFAIGIAPIIGVMLGLEFDFDERMIFMDLLIIRILVVY